MSIEVKLITPDSNIAYIVCEWLYNEFGRSTETLDFFKSLVSCKAAADGVPAAFVALKDGVAVGTVLLQRGDLMSRQDITPWLACIYVKPEYRKNHIGAALQNALLSYAGKHGFNRVYLYTDLVNYYEKTGWEYYGTGIECDGNIKRIFKKDLK